MHDERDDPFLLGSYRRSEQHWRLNSPCRPGLGVVTPGCIALCFRQSPIPFLLRYGPPVTFVAVSVARRPFLRRHQHVEIADRIASPATTMRPPSRRKPTNASASGELEARLGPGLFECCGQLLGNNGTEAFDFAQAPRLELSAQIVEGADLELVVNDRPGREIGSHLGFRGVPRLDRTWPRFLRFAAANVLRCRRYRAQYFVNAAA
jgi:hypothetical protein